MLQQPSISITVNDVRRIKQSTLTLPIGSRTVLIGPNNCGKSTLLETVHAALKSTTPRSAPNLPGSFYRREGDKILRPIVDITIAPIALLHRAETLTSSGNGDLEVGLIGASNAPSIRDDIGAAQFRLLPYLLEYRDGVYRRALLRGQENYAGHTVLSNDLSYLQASNTIRSEQHWRPLDEESPNHMSDASVNHFANWETPLARALRAFADRVYLFRAARDPSFAASNTENRLGPSTTNSVTALLKWLFYRRTNWKELQTAFTMIFDEVEELLFEDSPNGSVPFAVVGDGFKLPVADMGFGLRNVLHILTVVFALPEAAILLVDEPEQGLNQQKQRDFSAVLESVRPDVTMLFATQAEAFCRGLSKSSVCLAELSGNNASLTAVDVTTREGLRRVAKGMGINPLYLLEGGRILFVEGPSDRAIVERWLRLNFGELDDQVEVQELGGCGKIGEEFARPMFVNFADRVYFLLDSDGDSAANPLGAGIQERVRWFKRNAITKYTVLARREIENYIGAEALALAANIHPDRVRPLTGFESHFDFKRAFKSVLGYYDEKKISVAAFNSLSAESQRQLFAEENECLVASIRQFLAS